jgi:hypothetical protein
MCLDTVIKNTYRKIKVQEIFGVLRKSVTEKYLQELLVLRICYRKIIYKKTLLSKIIHVSRYCYKKYLQEN